jgi:outer membrane immunogenic protein
MTKLLGRAAAGALAIVAAAASPAPAADMRPVLKAPPPAIYNWTGFYVGANAGYSWGRSRNDWNFFVPNFFVGDTTCATLTGGGALCVAGGESSSLRGAIGGLQAGYNWQSGNYLVGVETDFQLSGQKGDGTFNGQTAVFAITGGVPVGTSISATYTERLRWLGTLRGRVGYASDGWLVYATGGLAYGRVAIDGSATSPGVPTLDLFGSACAGVGAVALLVGICPLANLSNSTTKAGWTLGFGAEGALAGGWSWKLEYLHVDLGSFTTTFALIPGCFGGGAGGAAACLQVGPGNTATVTSRITDEIVRVGLNYRFGPGPL